MYELKDFQNNLRIVLGKDTYTVLYIHCKNCLVDNNPKSNIMGIYGMNSLQYFMSRHIYISLKNTFSFKNEFSSLPFHIQPERKIHQILITTYAQFYIKNNRK